MTLRISAGALAGLLVVLFAAPPSADGQIWRRAAERAQDRAEQRIQRTADRAVDRAVDAAFELAEDEVACLAGDQRCVEQAEEAGVDVVLVDEQGNRVEDGAAAATPAPGEGAWANYDFVPGDRVLFFDDFSGETVGRFPRRLEFKNGMMEVVDWQGQRMLRSTNNRSHFRIDLPETLPQRFTIEFDARFQSGRLNDRIGVGTFAMDRINFMNPPHSMFYLSPRDAGVLGPVRSTAEANLPEDEMVSVRISVDETYAAMYLNERRVANVPNADIPRGNFVEVRFGAGNEPSLMTNLRIAAGGQAMMYDQLMADGRVVTRGILFDTGSDRIQPESTPTLNEIGQMLRQHGDLRLRIEGHTDNVGGAAMNQQLSERRAASVRQHLIQQFGIEAGRLEAVGMGQDNPADSNDTPEGRQNNRRVELVRL
jgi:OmpA-OmpF porin, OOP family